VGAGRVGRWREGWEKEWENNPDCGGGEGGLRGGGGGGVPWNGLTNVGYSWAKCLVAQAGRRADCKGKKKLEDRTG